MTTKSLQLENKLPFEAGWRAGLLSYARAGFLYLAIVVANLGLLVIFYGVRRAPLVALSVASVVVAIVSGVYALKMSSRLHAQQQVRTQLFEYWNNIRLAHLTEVPRLEEFPAQEVWFAQAELTLSTLVGEIANVQMVLSGVLNNAPEDNAVLREAITIVEFRLNILRQHVDELRKYLLSAKASGAAG